MNESEPRPVRRCAKCGAVLRRSNPSDLCAPCSGVRVEGLEPWMAPFVHASASGARSIARMLGYETHDNDSRNDAIIAAIESGKHAALVAREFGITQSGVNWVLERYGRR